MMKKINFNVFNVYAVAYYKNKRLKLCKNTVIYVHKISVRFACHTFFKILQFTAVFPYLIVIMLK